MKEWWTALISKLNEVTTIAILTHKDPDGDGLAAALALKAYLQWRDINSDIVLEAPSPRLYHYLQSDSMTRVVMPEMKYECLVILDCHEPSRLGECALLLDKAKYIFALDHHEKREVIQGSNTYINSSAVSVGYLLHTYMLPEIHKAPTSLQRYYADAIYTTILNDTDNFVNANTDETAFQTASELVELGLKPYKVAHQFLFNKPVLEMRFIGEVLATIETFHQGKVLFMHSTLEMLERNQLDQSATSKLTRWVKGIAGVEVTVYFREISSSQYRLSLRSVSYPVNKIAEVYGGGGHILAAGCTIDGTLDVVKDTMLRHFADIEHA